MRSLQDRLREAEQAEADERPVESRSDRRRLIAQRESELKRIAEQLVALRPRHLDNIPLSEEVIAAVKAAQSIQSGAAKNRQVLRVRQMLRDQELDVLEEALVLRPRAKPTKKVAPLCATWVERLVLEGDAALDELMRSHPTLDRQQLRKLSRNAARQDAGAESRHRLTALLAPHLEEPSSTDDAAARVEE